MTITDRQSMWRLFSNNISLTTLLEYRDFVQPYTAWGGLCTPPLIHHCTG